MFLYYIIISIILCILIFHGYNKVRYKFWATQPLFYRYNWANWFRLNQVCSTERPCDTIYLNFLSNIVSHITDTSIPITIDNIYINETERSINYYEDMVRILNKYPYFNKQLNNGNKMSLLIDRKMTAEKLKQNLMNHDYNAIVTMNKRLIYKNDISTSSVFSVDTVMGTIISLPYYCKFEMFNAKTGKGVIFPIYYSAIYYDPIEIHDKHVIEMIQSHNYKIYDDWDKALIRQIDYKEQCYINDKKTATQVTDVVNDRIKKGVKRQARENMLNSENSKIENHNTNPYQENGVHISKNKEKIYVSIYKYTGASIPKIIVPFVIYHRFYIPISSQPSQPSQDWNRIEYRFHPSIQLVKIGTQNVTLLYEFLECCYEGLNAQIPIPTPTHKSYKYKLPFKCTILPSLRHIFHMIKTDLCCIYVLLQKNNDIKVGGEMTNVIAMYMFSNSDDTISNDISIDKRHITYLTTSIMYGGGDIDSQKYAAPSFIYGFINALKLEMKERAIGCVAIDTLSHNKPLIDFLMVNTKPLMVEKNNLIFYNYICNTLSPDQVMIMN